MNSARNRSFRPEISGLKLEERLALSAAAGGLVAGTAAVADISAAERVPIEGRLFGNAAAGLQTLGLEGKHEFT